MIFAEKVIGLGVEFAAGAVFLTIIKLKLWDPLSFGHLLKRGKGRRRDAPK